MLERSFQDQLIARNEHRLRHIKANISTLIVGPTLSMPDDTKNLQLISELRQGLKI